MQHLVEALGLIALVVGLSVGAIDLQFAVLFGLLAYGYGLILALGALAMENHIDQSPLRLRDRAQQTLWVVVEQFGYRQMTVLWRLWGLWAVMRGDTRWGGQSRRGFTTATEQPA